MLVKGLPIKITQPGRYTLTQDLEFTSDGNAIEILANDVQLDLGGHKIIGAHKPGVFSTGVNVQGNNIEISNGSISGFMYGLNCPAEYAGHQLVNMSVHHVNFDHNYFRGIRVDDARNLDIHNNNITNTGGFVGYADSFAMGIEVCKGSQVQIYNNVVKEMHGVGEGEGIGLCLSDSIIQSKIFGNHIENMNVDDYSRSFGIWVVRGVMEIHDNYIKNFTYPLPETNLNNQPNEIIFTRNIIDGKYCLNDTPEFLANNAIIDDGTVCTDCPSYFRSAAEAGSSKAAFRLANSLNGAEQDEKYFWLLKASLDGHGEAARILNRDAQVYHIAEAEKYYLVTSMDEIEQDYI